MSENRFSNLIPPQNAGTTNRFEHLVPQNTGREEAEESESSFFEAIKTAGAAAQGFNTEIRSLGRGVQQLLTGAARLAGADTREMDRTIQQREQQDRARLDKVAGEFPTATFAGQIGGFLAQGALPVAGVAGRAAQGAKLLPSLGRAATEGAILGAAQFTPEDGSKLGQAALGGVVGAAVPGAIAAGRGVLGGLRQASQAVKGTSVADLTRGATPADVTRAKKVIRSAQELGTQVSPAEALGRAPLRGQESRLPLSNKTQDALADFVTTRARGQQASIDNVIESILPEGRAAAEATQKQMFDIADKVIIPKARAEKILNNPTVKRFADKIKNDPDKARLIRQFPEENSVARMSRISRSISNEIQQIKKGTTPGGSEKVRELETVRSKLDNILRKSSPEYDAAIEVSARLKNQDEIIKELRSIKPPEGASRATAEQFFDKFLRSPESRKEFFAKVNNSKDSRRSAVHLARTLQATFKSPLVKNLGKVTDESRIGVGDTLLTVKRRLQGMLQGSENEKMVHMITSGQWAKQLENINKLPNIEQQTGAFLELLSRVPRQAGVAASVGE